MKIALPSVVGGYNLERINSNFQTLANELNTRVWYRDNITGEPNTPAQNIDMNGKKLYNLPLPTSPSEPVTVAYANQYLSGAVTAELIALAAQVAQDKTDVDAMVDLATTQAGIAIVEANLAITAAGEAAAIVDAVNVSGTQTVTGQKTFSNVTTFTPPSSVLGVTSSQSGSGIVTRVPGYTDGYPRFSYQSVNITADSAQAVQGGIGKVSGFTIQHNLAGGSVATGGRDALMVELNVTSPTSGSNPDKNYVAATTQVKLSVPDASAGVFGHNPVAILGPAGASCMNLSGAEVNVTARTGTSVGYKSGIQIASLPDDVVQGSTYDAALSLSAQSGSVGWKSGILFSNANGDHPVSASGSLIETKGTDTVAYGICLASYQFSAAAITLPKGNGSISAANSDKSGNITIIDVDGSDNLVIGRGVASGKLFITPDGVVRKVSVGGIDSGGTGKRLLLVDN